MGKGKGSEYAGEKWGTGGRLHFFSRVLSPLPFPHLRLLRRLYKEWHLLPQPSLEFQIKIKTASSIGVRKVSPQLRDN